jgi:hypothetical protein
MSYRVVRSNYDATVVVDHATYPDYFKTTGGDKLTVYANSKDKCTADNTQDAAMLLSVAVIPADTLTDFRGGSDDGSKASVNAAKVTISKNANTYTIK